MKIIIAFVCAAVVLLLWYLLLKRRDRRRRDEHARLVISLHVMMLADRMKSLTPVQGQVRYLYRKMRKFTYAMCSEPDDSSALIIWRWEPERGPPLWEFLLEFRNPEQRYETEYASIDGRFAECVEKLMAAAKEACTPPPTVTP